eukprot:544503-Prymnesium_polylepis.1
MKLLLMSSNCDIGDAGGPLFQAGDPVRARVRLQKRSAPAAPVSCCMLEDEDEGRSCEWPMAYGAP